MKYLLLERGTLARVVSVAAVLALLWSMAGCGGSTSQTGGGLAAKEAGKGGGGEGSDNGSSKESAGDGSQGGGSAHSGESGGESAGGGSSSSTQGDDRSEKKSAGSGKSGSKENGDSAQSGGSGQAEKGSTNFIPEADRVCESSREKMSKGIKPYLARAGGLEHLRSAAPAMVHNVIIPGLKAEIAGVRSLDSRGQEKASAAIIGGLEGMVREGKSSPSSLMIDAHSVAESEAVAREYGFESCGPLF